MKIKVMIIFISLTFTISVHSQDVIYWISTFEDTTELEDYALSLDSTPGILCEGLPLDAGDYSMKVVPEFQGSENYVMELTSNIDSIAGLRIPIIAHRNVDSVITPGVRYAFEGYFRKSSPGSDLGKSLEHLDINLSVVIDSTEYFAEIFWTLNQWDPKYGWIWTRDTLCDVNNISCRDFGGAIKLLELAEDSNWHKFRIETQYLGITGNRIKKIIVDNSVTYLDLPMGTTKKHWDSHFKTLCEIQNLNTNCEVLKTFKGKAQWDSLFISSTTNPDHFYDLFNASVLDQTKWWVPESSAQPFFEDSCIGLVSYISDTDSIKTEIQSHSNFMYGKFEFIANSSHWKNGIIDSLDDTSIGLEIYYSDVDGVGAHDAIVVTNGALGILRSFFDSEGKQICHPEGDEGACDPLFQRYYPIPLWDILRKNEWNKFTIIWTEDNVDLLINDVVKVPHDPLPRDSIPNKPMKIRLNSYVNWNPNHGVTHDTLKVKALTYDSSIIFHIPSMVKESYHTFQNFDDDVDRIKTYSNFFGGDHGILPENPQCSIGYDTTQTWTGFGRSLKIDYGPLTGWSMYVESFKQRWYDSTVHFDLTNLFPDFNNPLLKGRSIDSIVFHYKLDAAEPLKMKIELKDSANQRSSYEFVAINSNRWERISVALGDFTGNFNAKYAKFMGFLFDSDLENNNKSGTFYLDDIYLVEQNFNKPVFSGTPDMLNYMNEVSFRHFWMAVDPVSKFAFDRHIWKDLISVDAIGFQLTSYVIAHKNNWINQTLIEERVEHILDYLLNHCPHATDSNQVKADPLKYATVEGNWAHFLNNATLARKDDHTEYSLFTNALLLPGVLICQAYFNNNPKINNLADSLYRMTNWRFLYYPDSNAMFFAWSPESSFTKNYSDYFSEEFDLAFLLALSNPDTNHRIPQNPFYASCYKKPLCEIVTGNYINSYPGANFTYYFLQMYARFPRDSINGVGRFNNAKNALLADVAFCQQEYQYLGYDSRIYGTTACEGPDSAGEDASGNRISNYHAYGYPCRDEPLHNPNGTIAVYGSGATMPFIPSEAISCLHYYYTELDDKFRDSYGYSFWSPIFGLPDAFHLRPDDCKDETVNSLGFRGPWLSVPRFGIDVGPMLMNIDSYLSEINNETSIRDLFSNHPYIIDNLNQFDKFDFTPPDMISSLQVTGYSDSSISFSWATPSNEDYKGTMVRYSFKDYPSDETDEMLAFLENTTGKNDTATFTHSPIPSCTTFYYSFFAYDTAQNYSPAAQIQYRTNCLPKIDPITDTLAIEDSLYQCTINATDPDTGDTLLHYLTSAPHSMTIDSSSGLISWEPVDSNVGTHAITISVTDNLEASATLQCTLRVINRNDPPIIEPISNPPAILEDAGEQTINLLGINDGDLQVLQGIQIIARSSNSLLVPDPLVLYQSDDTVGELKFTPNTNAFGTVAIEVLVKDNGGILYGGIDTLKTSFNVDVLPVNDPPQLDNPIPDQIITRNMPYSYSIDTNTTFSDPDTSDILTYNATLANGDSLPAWLDFNAQTKLFSGTPSESDIQYLIKVIVQDKDNLTACDTFILEEPVNILIDDKDITKKLPVFSFWAVPNPVNSKTKRKIIFKYKATQRLDAMLKIYDAIGNIIFERDIEVEKSVKPSIFATWNLNNLHGNKVTGGTYLAVVTITDKSNKLRKFKAHIGIKE